MLVLDLTFVKLLLLLLRRRLRLRLRLLLGCSGRGVCGGGGGGGGGSGQKSLAACFDAFAANNPLFLRGWLLTSDGLVCRITFNTQSSW